MSLLLDALNRASRDKAAATATAATAATAQPASLLNLQPASSKTFVAPAQPQSETTVLVSTPNEAPAWPSLDLKSSTPQIASEIPKTTPQLAIEEACLVSAPMVSLPESATEQILPTPLAFGVSEQPIISLSLTPKPEESKIEAFAGDPIANQSASKDTQTFSSKISNDTGRVPDATDGTRVAQQIVRAKAPSVHPSNRRLWVLGCLALFFGAGFTSILSGAWGDPVLLAQTMFWSNANLGSTVAAPPAPTAALPEALASEAMPVNTATDKASIPVQATRTKPQAVSATPSRRQLSTSSRAATVAPSVVCPPGTTAANCLELSQAVKTSSYASAENSNQARIQTRNSQPSLLEQAYAALTLGHLNEADQAYLQAIRSNPLERDALLGLAYIAQQRGQADQAQQYYKQVLRQEPTNALARAAMAMLNPTSDRQDFGNNARSIAEQNPNSAAAQSVLGFALVRQDRLAEAQLAFFRALQLEPKVARHAFNLAVALDRLHQYDDARIYYERAASLVMQAGTDRASGFSLTDVQARLKQLRSASETSPLQ